MGIRATSGGWEAGQGAFVLFFFLNGLIFFFLLNKHEYIYVCVCIYIYFFFYKTFVEWGGGLFASHHHSSSKF